MADTINSSSDEEYWSESENKSDQSASEKEGSPSVKAKRSREVSATPEKEESPSVEIVPPKRSRKVPARFKDSACTPTTFKAAEGFDAMMKDKKVTVKCNQTGKVLKVRGSLLSRSDDGNMTKADLAEGCQLLLTMDKKQYPVTVCNSSASLKEALAEVQVNETKKAGSSKGQKRRGPKESGTSQSKKSKAASTIDKENLALAKAQFNNHTQIANTKASSSQDDLGTATGNSSSLDRELLLQLNAKLDTLIALVKGGAVASVDISTTVKDEGDSKFVVDGINLLRIPSKDASAYGRALLDTIFTKAEQKTHVLFKTSKSSKPPLDRARVELMFECINRRYKDKYEYAALVSSLKQKCRDAKPEV